MLTVYAPRAPIFADEDLNLLQLLAQQAAVILESRACLLMKPPEFAPGRKWPV